MSDKGPAIRAPRKAPSSRIAVKRPLVSVFVNCRGKVKKCRVKGGNETYSSGVSLLKAVHDLDLTENALQ